MDIVLFIFFVICICRGLGDLTSENPISDSWAFRMLTFNEMVERKLIRKNCAAKKIPTILEEEQVYAKSKDDAYDVAMREHPKWFIKEIK